MGCIFHDSLLENGNQFYGAAVIVLCVAVLAQAVFAELNAEVSFVFAPVGPEQAAYGYIAIDFGTGFLITCAFKVQIDQVIALRF
jgi:hypothetical protein